MKPTVPLWGWLLIALALPVSAVLVLVLIPVTVTLGVAQIVADYFGWRMPWDADTRKPEPL